MEDGPHGVGGRGCKVGCATATHLRQLFPHSSAVPGPQPGSSSHLLPQPLSSPAAPQRRALWGLELTAPLDTETTQAWWHGSEAVGQWHGHGSVAWPHHRAARDGTDTRILIKAAVQCCSPAPYCGTCWPAPQHGQRWEHPSAWHPTHTARCCPGPGAQCPLPAQPTAQMHRRAGMAEGLTT